MNKQNGTTRRLIQESEKAHMLTIPFVFSRVIARISMDEKNTLTSTMKQYGVGASEYPVLLALLAGEMQGIKGVSQLEISCAVARDPALTSRAVRQLESKGLVKIEQDESRKSRNSIVLTDEGKKVARVAYTKTEDWNNKALNTLEADQRKVLEDALETILEKMLPIS